MPEVSTIESLTKENLNQFFRRIQTRQRLVGKGTIKIGVKNSTIKTQHSKLGAFFTWLHANNYITTNPLREILAPKVSYDDFRRLEDDNVQKLYAGIALRSDNALLHRRDTAMVSLLAYCGLRRGELISLRVTDIDMNKKQLLVRGETSKSKKNRTLVMNDVLVLHLKDYLRERNISGFKTEKLLVSRRDDRGLSMEGLIHWVNGLIKKSGVKFHLHQLRHTFASKLSEKDVNVFKIQKMMGHTDIRMTMKYARSLRPEDMAEDVGKISFS